MFSLESRYECNKCGAVVSAGMLAHCKWDIDKNKNCPFCNGVPTIYNIDCRNRLIGIFDHFNSTSHGQLAEAVFVEDNGITNPRLVVRLRCDFIHGNGNLRLPYGFVITGHGTRDIMSPIEFMYEIKRKTDSQVGDLMDETHQAVRKLHAWIAKYLP